MGKKIRLSESQFKTMIMRIVKESKYQYDEEIIEDDIEYDDEEEEGFDELEIPGDMPSYKTKYRYSDDDKEKLSNPEIIDIISNFFEEEVLPEASTEEITKLNRMSKKIKSSMNERYLGENLKNRFSKFKDNTMMAVGSSAAVTGMLGFASQVAGWSESELMTKLHEYFQSFGYGQETGPLSVGLIAAGLAVALAGYSGKANKLNTPYTKTKSKNGFNSY